MRAQTAQWGFPDAAESGSQTRLRYMESGERYDNPSVDSDRYRLSDSGQGLCDSTQHSHFLLGIPVKLKVFHPRRDFAKKLSSVGSGDFGRDFGNSLFPP